MIKNINTGAGLIVSNPGMYEETAILSLHLPSNPDFIVLSNRVETIEKVLGILHPSSELHDQYPALKEAYEAYKIIENLITGKT